MYKFCLLTTSLFPCDIEAGSDRERGLWREQAAAGKAVPGLGDGDAATGKDPQQSRIREDGQAQRHAAEDTVWQRGQVPRYLRRYIEEQGRTEAIGQSKNSPQWTQSSQRKSWLLLTFAFFASFAVTCFRAQC